MKNNTKRIWSLLCKAHNINKSILKGVEPTEGEMFLYEQKDNLLSEVCKEVLHTSIRASWSYAGGNHLLYFELGDKQLSFHSIYGNYGLPVELMDTIQWDGFVKNYAVPDEDSNYPGLEESRAYSRITLKEGFWIPFELREELKNIKGCRRQRKYLMSLRDL